MRIRKADDQVINIKGSADATDYTKFENYSTINVEKNVKKLKYGMHPEGATHFGMDHIIGMVHVILNIGMNSGSLLGARGRYNDITVHGDVGKQALYGANNTRFKAMEDVDDCLGCESRSCIVEVNGSVGNDVATDAHNIKLIVDKNAGSYLCDGTSNSYAWVKGDVGSFVGHKLKERSEIWVGGHAKEGIGAYSEPGTSIHLMGTFDGFGKDVGATIYIHKEQPSEILEKLKTMDLDIIYKGTKL